MPQTLHHHQPIHLMETASTSEHNRYQQAKYGLLLNLRECNNILDNIQQRHKQQK